jgi:hypothetical protein
MLLLLFEAADAFGWLADRRPLGGWLEDCPPLFPALMRTTGRAAAAYAPT